MPSGMGVGSDAAAVTVAMIENAAPKKSHMERVSAGIGQKMESKRTKLI